MYDYFVRITHPYEELVRLVATWALECSSLAVFEHVGSQTEKVHCHMVILGSRLQKKQLRNIGQQYAVLKGNEYCSFKECISWEVPLVYMTKGSLSASYLKTFTLEQIDIARSKWVAPRSYVKKTRIQVVTEDFFEDYPLEKQLKDVEPEDLIDGEWTSNKFNLVRKRAYRVAADEYNGILNPQFWTMFKTLVWSYCYKYNISFPKNTNWDKW